jgi:CBS domain-containing protein
MKAADAMSRDLLTVTPDSTIASAIELMIEHRVSGLPVVTRDGQVAGVITEGDLLRRPETGTDVSHSLWRALLGSPGREAEEYARAHGRQVGEVMSRGIVSAPPDVDLAGVVSLMEAHHVKRVLILERDRLVGIITRADILRALLQELSDSPDPGTNDQEIRQRFRTALQELRWAPRATVTGSVTNGTLTLEGVILDPRERGALHVIAENIPGVRRVIDRLVWVEPICGLIADGPPVDASEVLTDPIKP